MTLLASLFRTLGAMGGLSTRAISTLLGQPAVTLEHVPKRN